jgi:hypothetical protein
MRTPKRDVGAEIAKRLEAARVPGTSNALSLPAIKKWLREYLADREKEAEPTDRPHWDLLMQDGGPEPGFFVVFVFHPRPRGFEFLCGTGDSFQVRSFCEGEAAEDAGGLLEGFRARFTVPGGTLRVSRKAAEEWLGRDW